MKFTFRNSASMFATMQTDKTETISTKLSGTMFRQIDDVVTELNLSRHKAAERLIGAVLDTDEIKVWFDDDTILADLPANYVHACVANDMIITNILKECLNRGYRKLMPLKRA